MEEKGFISNVLDDLIGNMSKRQGQKLKIIILGGNGKNDEDEEKEYEEKEDDEGLDSVFGKKSLKDLIGK